MTTGAIRYTSFTRSMIGYESIGVECNRTVFRILDATTKGVIVPVWSDKKPDYTHDDSLRRFAELVWVWNPITTEWENIPVQTMIRLQELWLIVFPDPYFLERIQDRVLEKRLATSLWWKPVVYREVNTYQWLVQWVRSLNKECILKSRKWGYDGKLQWKITEKTDLKALWYDVQKEAPDASFILEEKIDLDFEVSTILGIDKYWSVRIIGPVYNIHENGTLRYSIDPAPISSEINSKILAEARKLWSNAKKKWYIGLLTIEWFVSKDGTLYVNEFAPRPHNSGHASLDGRDYSQNDLWMQAVNGNVARDPRVKQPIVMENILAQDELARVMLNASIDPSRLGTWRESRFYDYQKLPGFPDPTNTSVRKLWHINHWGSKVEDFWEKAQRWSISMDEFVRQIRVLPERTRSK